MTQLYIRVPSTRMARAVQPRMSTSTCPCIVFRNEMDQSRRKVAVDT